MQALQKRINDAAAHFEPKFSAYQHAIQNHPLITEHKEAATVINEYLTQLLLAVYTTNYFLKYCKQPFSVTSFLQHKLKFAQPRFNITCYASGKKQSFSDIPNAEFYDALKRWRDMVCEETDMPIYMVANQATLKEIATYLPLTKKDLLQISGFGKAKVDKYGDDILAIGRKLLQQASILKPIWQLKRQILKENEKKKPLKKKPIPKHFHLIYLKKVNLLPKLPGKEILPLAQLRATWHGL